MKLRKLLAVTILTFFTSSANLMAEVFIPKHATCEKNGKAIKISDLSGFPSFNADFYPSEHIVKIKCSAGNLILKKGTFFYAYRGVHKGLTITATATVQNNKLESIVYEEWDRGKNTKVIISYYPPKSR